MTFWDELSKGAPALEQSNPNFETFVEVGADDSIIQDESVVERVLSAMRQQNGEEGTFGYSANSIIDKLYAQTPTDKLTRLRAYRTMGAYPKVEDCTDEITDYFINHDESGRIANIKFSETLKLRDSQKKTIEEEWQRFFSLFNFEEHGYNIVKSYLTDGEVCWENIINVKKTNYGIIGVKRIPNESFHYLVDDSMERMGLIFNAKLITGDNDNYERSMEAGREEIQTTLSRQGYNAANIYGKSNKNPIIVMPNKQVTLINTDKYAPMGTAPIPVLEHARRAYTQLALIEDAILIYRLVRAPERLVFNVDTGTLPANRAEQIVRQMANRYQSKRVYDSASGGVVRGYDPHQMLESYWFPKRDGVGTDVSVLQSGFNLGELEDLNYFVKQLYRSLKVPYSRYDDDSNLLQNGEEGISAEEFRFSKFIIRLQKDFSRGLFEGFKTHLQLRGLWDKFKMLDTAFNVVMVPPSAYELYQSQQLFNLKLKNYDDVVAHEEFSKELAMKKILGMSEIEIQENNRRVMKERMQEAQMQRMVDNILATGNPDDPNIAGFFGG